MKDLPSWITVYSYTKEFVDRGKKAKEVLRKHTIYFKTEFDHIINAVLVLVRKDDYFKALKLLEKEGLM